jgi:CRISPR/Cas system-associated exonuclease Cas4 (RecB family)
LLNLGRLKERQMDIELLYHSYLVQADNLREKDEKLFHASSAGSCLRKQMYSYYDFPQDRKDKRSYRILRLGTIVHKDIEEAIANYEDVNSGGNEQVFIEDKIELEELNVVGTYDVGRIDMEENKFTLWDIKTAAAYKWTTKFGRKQNRKPSSDTNYKLQLGTYALGINQKFKVGKIEMYLLWYNKNTSQMREQIVSPEWIEKALEYWVTVNETLEDMDEHFEEELKPEYYLGVPYQDWECRYCQYYSICPSTLADKKRY